MVFVAFLAICSCNQEENLVSGTQAEDAVSDSTLTDKFKNKEYLVFKGSENQLGNGKTRSWLLVDKRTGKPEEFGVEMTTEGESHANTIYAKLHPKTKNLTSFDHIGINWEPQGHPSPPLYNGTFFVPHFYIHFYMIPFKEREAITFGMILILTTLQMRF